MKKFISSLLIVLMVIGLSGCKSAPETVKIGVSFGVGAAARWEKELEYMQAYADEQKIPIEIRLNRTDEPLTQAEDCKEMIDNGINVLIITARDVYNMKETIEYAKSKNVPVISYARLIMNDTHDLYIGYDSNRIGQKMGQYLSETVINGNYAILHGDPKDANALQTYQGAMRYIEQIEPDINIILDAAVEGWSVDEAKKLLKEALIANDNKVNAIFAPNDKIAGASREVLKELGITDKVYITGMDAELDAIKRIVNDEQDMTVYMDLKTLAEKAVIEAVKLAKAEKTDINSTVDNAGEVPQNSHLITGQTITKENIDKVLIGTGVFAKEDVYGN